jgi:excisionase family DNA binding protein
MEPRLSEDGRLRARRRSRDEILTSREAMALLKIGRTKLWELTRDNVIPAYRVGQGRNSALRFKRSDLLAWLERNRV